jgi:tryptophanyl-tRNA synthetase
VDLYDRPVARVFSGIQPSGELHLGNYLGALRQFAFDQYDHDAVFCIVDLHALTVPQDPGELRRRTLEAARIHMAAGLDPSVCTLFVQSHVHEHAELSWLMECTASVGELRRMTQFKEKADKASDQEFVAAALFTYPALMAADILLYEADRVPVGADQRQHLELARDLALRFNHRFGDTFVVPTAAVPRVGARIMDLQRPTEKMSKSVISPQGTVGLLEDPASIVRKIRRAVTDTEVEVRYDPQAKPGVSNLLTILGATTGEDPERLARRYHQYGELKADCAEAIVALLEPIQARYAELAADPSGTAAVLAEGAGKARAVAAPVLDRARAAVGLLPR